MRQHIFRWPRLAAPAEDHPEPAPPRPLRQDPGPVTAPRLFAPSGPVNAEFDPCGAPPVSSSENEGQA